MPSLDSLTPDPSQGVVINLSADRTAVVTGVAGSGKSLILLKKAKQVAAQTSSYAIVVYTKSLKQFFIEELREIDSTGRHVYHYAQWMAKPNKPHYDYLFVDECQDFTDQDIANFQQHGTYCWFFGDTDQTIMTFNGRKPQSVRATQNQLGILRPYQFAINYRLTKENAALCEHIGRQVNPNLRLVEACVKHGDKPELIQSNDPFGYLLNFCNEHPGEDIGILAYLNDQVIAIKDYFEKNGLPVQWKTQDNMHLDFQSTSPKVITWHCSKGLQFEHVFILFGGSNDYNYYVDPYMSCISALYVACSRPLEKMTIVHKSTPYATFPSKNSSIWKNTQFSSPNSFTSGNPF